MIIVNTDNLSLSFGTDKILDGVTFALNEGDHLGIIGVNGCGKSTLFRLILGELEPDEGKVYLSKNKTVGILRQNDAFRDFKEEREDASSLEVMYHSFPELLELEGRLARLEDQLKSGALGDRTEESLVAEFTALNDRFLREGGLEFRGRCASTLQKMGFTPQEMNRPFSSLSGGQRTRLALSRELCREPDLLMLDEPTNHLDVETLEWLEGFLSGYKKCVMVISHDRYFLNRVTNKTLCIEHLHAKLYNGNYSKSMTQRQIDREIEERHYKNQQREIARQEAYIAQQRVWNREKNIIAAESRQKMLDKMVRLERPREAPRPIQMRFSSSLSSGNEVLTVKDLSFGYTPASPLLKGVSFLVRKNERLFLVGPNGSGKSTLIKLLIGKLQPSGGYVEAGYNVTIGYYDQENQNLTPTNTVLEELWNAYPHLTELLIRSTLARFRFTGDEVYKSVSLLSGGEKARLTLAKLILSEMNLLILDEPTNHLDIDSREALEAALREFDGTVITVTHDRYLIEKLATRLLDLSNGDVTDISVSRSGEGYEELCRDRARRSVLESPSAPAPQPNAETQKDRYLKNKQEASDARRAQKRLERLRAEADRLEKELERIEEEMAGDAATDYLRLSELDQRKNEIEERLLLLYEEI